MQTAGSSALQIAFERLKQQLEKEGLFIPENKKQSLFSPQLLTLSLRPQMLLSRYFKSIKKKY